MNNKILSLLGFATKSGNLDFGFEATVSALKARRSKLIIIAQDISAKSVKEISFYAEKNNVEVIKLLGIDIQTVSAAVGRKCGIISVNDSGFALALKEQTEGGNANDK